MRSNDFKFFGMHSNAFRTLWNALERFGMKRNDIWKSKKRYRMKKNAFECVRMHSNDFKFFGMHSNAFRTLSNALERFWTIMEWEWNAGCWKNAGSTVNVTYLKFTCISNYNMYLIFEQKLFNKRNSILFVFHPYVF